jgi:hypothetical protein
MIMKRFISFIQEEYMVKEQRNRMLFCPGLQILLYLFITFFCFAFLCAAAIAETENPKVAWQEVLSAVKAIQNPPTGKGSALVAFTGPPESRVAIMDFEFKDDLSRSDMFLITNNGEKNKRDVTWSQGKDYSVVYNPSNVTLERTTAKQFYRKIGYDFNPDTFLQWRNQPILSRLEKYFSGPGVLSVEKDANGILHLIGKYEDPNQRHYRVSSFDPAKGYRPVHIYDSIEFLKDRRKDINDTYTIEWAKYGSVWYVKSAKIESVYWAKDLNAPAKGGVEVVIQNFEPNVNIDSNEFSIEGLGVPEGTTVVDKIAERQYKYGSQ